jgi:hypothetical protein
MDDRLLRPDAAIISTIFTEPRPTSIETLANCFTNCTFKAEFDERPAVIVRLDTSSGLLTVVSAIQEAASLQIPTYVPEVLTSGTVVTATQKNVDYTVTRFVSGTTTLDSVWPSLTIGQKQALFDAVVDAVDKLQQLDFSRNPAQKVLRNTPLVRSGEEASIGGPKIGFAKDIRGFLALFAARHQSESFATSYIEESLDGDGIIIKSALQN